jgi:glycosyltransferase involved in cell wall biosynthesis
MYSSDRTLEIANKYNCKIVYHEKCEIVEPARNFAIQSASHPWILLIDADEVVPKALHDYLYKLIKEKSDIHGLWLNLKNFFMGSFLHGNYPDHIMRFFRKDSVSWLPYVHSRPKIKGRTTYLPKSRKELAVIHLDNSNISKKLQKMNVYTDNEIVKRSGKSYSVWQMFTAPFFRFFKSYFLKGGFRDGKAGIIVAGIDAFYKFITIAKIWESQMQDKYQDKDLK